MTTNGTFDQAVMAAAREMAGLEDGEDWPTNAALGGSPTDTRDDEYRHGMLEQAEDALHRAVPVLLDPLQRWISHQWGKSAETDGLLDDLTALLDDINGGCR